METNENSANASLVKRVKDFFNEPSYKNFDFEIVRIDVLGYLVVGVLDSQGEYDIYFDTSEWQYAIPEIWQGLVEVNGVAVLPGMGRAPCVRDANDALGFAKSQLKSKTGRRLADHPQPADV